MDRALVEVIKREWKDALFTSLGRFPESATRNDLYLALAIAARREVLRRSVMTSETYYRKASRTVCYLSAEFLLGPHLGNNLLNLGIEAETAAGDVGARARPRPILRAGRGAGARQRRPRAPRRLLPGLARDARDPRDRLRHPLRVRHLRPGDPRRLAGRAHRQVAARSAIRGRSRARRSRFDVSFGGHTEAVHRRARRATACAGCPSASSAASPTTRRSSATANGTVNLLRLWKAEAARVVRLRRPSTSATTTAPSSEKVASENITKVLYPNDELAAGQAAAARAAVLLRRPARCRT